MRAIFPRACRRTAAPGARHCAPGAGSSPCAPGRVETICGVRGHADRWPAFPGDRLQPPPRSAKLNAALDRIAERFGSKAITTADLAESGSTADDEDPWGRP